MKLAKLKGEGNKLSAKLIKARKKEANLLNLVADIKILLYWLKIDILSLAGSEWSERMEMMNFIISELQQRENQAHKGIRALRVALSNQKSDLLAFAEVLDQKLADIAHKFQISLSQVREVCLLMKKSLSTNVYWQRWNQENPATFREIPASKGSSRISYEIHPQSQFLSGEPQFSPQKLFFLEKASEF